MAFIELPQPFQRNPKRREAYIFLDIPPIPTKSLRKAAIVARERTIGGVLTGLESLDEAVEEVESEESEEEPEVVIEGDKFLTVDKEKVSRETRLRYRTANDTTVQTGCTEGYLSSMPGGQQGGENVLLQYGSEMQFTVLPKLCRGTVRRCLFFRRPTLMADSFYPGTTFTLMLNPGCSYVRSVKGTAIARLASTKANSSKSSTSLKSWTVLQRNSAES